MIHILASRRHCLRKEFLTPDLALAMFMKQFREEGTEIRLLNADYPVKISMKNNGVRLTARNEMSNLDVNLADGDEYILNDSRINSYKREAGFRK